MKKSLKALTRLGVCLGIVANLVVCSAVAMEEQRDPISIDVVDAPLADVLAGFGQMSESQLSRAPGLDAKISLRLDQVSWTTALDAVCETAGCSWSLVEGPPRLLKIEANGSKPSTDGVKQRLELTFVDLPRREALDRLVGKAGLEAGVEGELSGTLSMTLDGVTLSTALKALCEPVGCLWRFAKRSTPPISVFPRSLGDSTAAAVLGDFGDIAAAEDSNIEEKLRTPLDLSLKDAPVAAVLKSFGSVLDCSVSIPPDLDALVTIELDGTPAADAIDKVCLLVGCRWRMSFAGEKPGLVIEKK